MFIGIENGDRKPLQILYHLVKNHLLYLL